MTTSDQDYLNRDAQEWPADPPAQPNLLFVLSGPSGVGKDTVISLLKQKGLPLHFTITVTTRAMREGEIDGVNYYFVSQEEFLDLQRRGALLEWAVVHGHHYGTPVEQVRSALRSGRDVLLKIDVQGAAKLKQRVPDAVFIFLAPPSVDELLNRLVNRGTESSDERGRRLRDAYEEMRHLPSYDYAIVNRQGGAAEAAEMVKSVIVAEKNRVHPRQIEL